VSITSKLSQRFHAKTKHRCSGRSEENEDLLDVAFDVLLFLADHVESDSLREGSALSDGDDVADLDTESRGAVGGDSSVALLEPVVLLDVMQVVTTDDNRASHFG
jgi:hypothetical protein